MLFAIFLFTCTECEKSGIVDRIMRILKKSVLSATAFLGFYEGTENLRLQFPEVFTYFYHCQYHDKTS